MLAGPKMSTCLVLEGGPYKKFDPSKSVLNLYTSLMTYIIISTLTCFSHARDLNVSADVIDDLSRFKYDGEN